MIKFRWETEFKETEIGRIPREWEIKEVKNLVDSNKKYPIVDGPFGTQLHMEEYKQEGIPVIRVVNLAFDGRFLNDDLVYISEAKFRELIRSEVRPNDLIIAKTGATIGKLALLPDNIPRALIASSCLKVSFDIQKANPKYYLYLFMSHIGQESIKLRADGGSTRPTINLTPFSEISVPYPQPQEQQKIATVLSWFDDLIENKKRQNEILEKTAMAIFKSWFVDFEPFKDGEFVDSELGKIPKGWEVKAIGDSKISELIKGISYKSSEIISESQGSLFITLNNFLRGGGFKTEYIYYVGNKAKEEQRVKDGDLIIALTDMTSEAKVVGAPAVVALPYGFKFALISLDCAKIRMAREDIRFYLYLYLKYSQEENATFANGVNVLHLNTKLFIKSKLFLFPVEHILQKFHSLVEPLFQKIILNQKQIMVLRKIRDALLPLLVFGKLRVVEI